MRDGMHSVSVNKIMVLNERREQEYCEIVRNAHTYAKSVEQSNASHHFASRI
ncbi:MAG: hypothetical protein ABSA46_20580 [Thermodesulfovibrionales bacterium]|jgi:hypothetical protein